MRKWRIAAAAPALGAALILFGCGNGDMPDGEPAPTVDQGVTAEPAADDMSVPPAMQAFEDDGDVIEIEIEGNDQIQYDIDEFTVRAGQMVRLTLRHVGTLPAQAMGHNVVIIMPDDDVFEFGADVGEEDGSLENDYVPVALRDRVVAFTPILGGGETVTVEFQAPTEPGEYPFLCSFPGHFGQMNGVMYVEA